MKNHHLIAIITPLVCIACFFVLLQLNMGSAPAMTVSLTLLIVVFWVTETLPIPITSLLPFVLFPLFGILDHKQASSALGSHVILLLMGAFMLSKALEKSQVHERLAVYMVNLVGVHSGRRLVIGFMLATAILSMWISNTATVLIMLPMALAVLSHIENRKLKVALILGIAYAASVGGVGTLIGTPPNVIFMGIFEQFTQTEFGFIEWMKVGVPVVLISVPIMGLWLTRNVTLDERINMPVQGKWRTEEKRTLAVFALTALAWITRKEPFGGWSGALDLPQVGDSSIALAAVVIMAMIPNGKGSRLLDWDTAKTIPWGMLLLFAGGIVIAKAFVASGLSDILASGLVELANLPILLTLLCICLAVTYLTEITSNTATATLLMPILASAAIATGLPPQVLMIPAAICASCAFMLPVATAPNAIAFGTKQIDILDMVKEGAVLSLLVSCIVALCCYWILI
ncbi:SLC13 family permease [Thalassotalea mangrovi]|uniref:SLC13/DASS family transporter n=1 Tax=Thalassotalea mangrovi TaxID=2572245 RepID=A0A4U1B5I8_9GAMM|nr:SLC13 family permease [Thalassotalea mangrovi]TKB45714.1 SLC13/DASS family transporter [Thalassotalea mangrovi]